MNSLQETPKSTVANVAANDDHMGDRNHRIVVTPVTESGQGWDAFDVWRRFIKDARDRREGRDQANHS
jgi:hypothetical protein